MSPAGEVGLMVELVVALMERGVAAAEQGVERTPGLGRY